MVATSGSQLLPQTAVRHLRLRLLPITTILTPNIPEAKLLVQDADDSHNEATPIRGVEDIIDLAHRVQALGPEYVLVKGGHVPLTSSLNTATSDAERKTIINVLSSKAQTLVLQMQYQPSRNTHGTGCSLACKSLLLPPLMMPSFQPLFQSYFATRCSHSLPYPLIIHY